MIGDRLKEIRKDHHDTQADLATKLKVSVSTIQSWEQEKSEPNHEMLTTVCRLYQVSSDFLLGLRDNDPFLGGSSSLERLLTPEDRKSLVDFASFLICRNHREHQIHP